MTYNDLKFGQEIYHIDDWDGGCFIRKRTVHSFAKGYFQLFGAERCFRYDDKGRTWFTDLEEAKKYVLKQYEDYKLVYSNDREWFFKVPEDLEMDADSILERLKQNYYLFESCDYYKNDYFNDLNALERMLKERAAFGESE